MLYIKTKKLTKKSRTYAACRGFFLYSTVKHPCNDDENDNRFYEPIGRFPTIEEDEPAYRLLCNEYPKAEK